LVIVCDPAINYAFQQNAIPVVKKLRFQNDGVARKNLAIRVSTEPAFAAAEGFGPADHRTGMRVGSRMD